MILRKDIQHLLDRLLHRGTIEMEAIVETIGEGGEFSVLLPNVRNGRGLYRLKLKRLDGQDPPKIGQMILVKVRVTGLVK